MTTWDGCVSEYVCLCVPQSGDNLMTCLLLHIITPVLYYLDYRLFNIHRENSSNLNSLLVMYFFICLNLYSIYYTF